VPDEFSAEMGIEPDYLRVRNKGWGFGRALIVAASGQPAVSPTSFTSLSVSARPYNEAAEAMRRALHGAFDMADMLTVNI
jgi:hypothetical protein